MLLGGRLLATGVLNAVSMQYLDLELKSADWNGEDIHIDNETVVASTVVSALLQLIPILLPPFPSVQWKGQIQLALSKILKL